MTLVSLREPLEGPLDFLGGAARPAAIVVVTLLLSYATLVIGELAPKRVAMQRAERWALLSARPLSAMATLTRPIVWLLSRSTDIAVRLLGGDPSVQREEVTEAELRELVGTQTTITAKQRLIIDGAFEISERTLDEVLRPRPDVFVLDADQPAAEALRALVDSGHSRAPVAHDANLDDVDGMPEGPYATVAGLVLDVLGRVPDAPGDRVTVAGRTIEVLAVDGRAITEVRVSPPQDRAGPTEELRPVEPEEIAAAAQRSRK